MQLVTLPKLNNNDDSCVLVEWCCTAGSRVTLDTTLAILETSKATVELVAEEAGILEIVKKAGGEYAFGTVIGYLFDDEAQRQEFMSEARKAVHAPGEAKKLTVTRGARELMEEHNLSDADLASLGKTVIKRSDIEALVDGQAKTTATGKEIVLSRRQQSIAGTVSLSHNTIPKAFLLMRFPCDNALAALRQLAQKESLLIGLPELLVYVTALLADRFPFFFGELLEGGRFLPASEPNVGVTFDAGKGLFIPVIQAARTRSMRHIAEDMLRFRINAMGDAFKQEDLTGGHITITLNTDRDIVFALPIILPGQSCMISLGAVQNELAWEGGAVVTRNIVHMGLAYDHRVINGYDAVQFLKSIKSAFEEPAIFDASASGLQRTTNQ